MTLFFIGLVYGFIMPIVFIQLVKSDEMQFSRQFEYRGILFGIFTLLWPLLFIYIGIRELILWWKNRSKTEECANLTVTPIKEKIDEAKELIENQDNIKEYLDDCGKRILFNNYNVLRAAQHLPPASVEEFEIYYQQHILPETEFNESEEEDE